MLHSAALASTVVEFKNGTSLNLYIYYILTMGISSKSV